MRPGALSSGGVRRSTSAQSGSFGVCIEFDVRAPMPDRRRHVLGDDRDTLGDGVEQARASPLGLRHRELDPKIRVRNEEIDERDQAGSPAVAVVNEQLARKYFGDENPVGRRITFPEEKREFEIAGVSANLRNGSLKTESAMTVFIPMSQVEPNGMTYALRTTGDPLRFVKTVRELVRQADASLAPAPSIPVPTA